MKGYFSQLARHSGLDFGIGGTKAVSPLTSGSAATHPESHHDGSSLHVDEVTFTSTSQLTADTSERTNEDIVGHVSIAPISEEDRESSSDRTADGGKAREEEFRKAGFDDESKTRSTRIEFSPADFFEESTIGPASSESKSNVRHASGEDEYSAAKPSRMIEHQRFVISEKPSPTARRPGSKQPSKRVAAFEDPHATSPYRREGPPDQNQQPQLLEGEGRGSFQAIESGERRDADPREAMDRHVMVRNYWKEVRDWVAAPPDMEEAELEFHTSEEAHQRSGDVSSLERGTTAAALTPRPGSEEPELQELSLSIGTISIVIEEPQKDVPIQQALPAATQRVLERTTSESIDLSRYYLRSW